MTNDDSFKNDKGDSIVTVTKDDEGNVTKTVIDFGKLDVDQQGEAKPEHEEVDKVIIAPQESTENTTLIGGDANGNLVLDMSGKDLDVTGKTKGEAKAAKGIEAVDGSVEIKNAGNIVIVTEATGNNGKASAIYASGAGKDVIIETKNADNIVKLSAKDNDKTSGVLHAEDKANVTINGYVDITETNGKVAVNVGEGSTVTLAGGEIGAKKKVEGDENVAIQVTEGGKIKINEDGNQKVVINGKIVFGVAKPVEEQAAPVMMKLTRRMVVPDEGSFVNLTDGDELKDSIEFKGAGDNKLAVNVIGKDSAWTGNSLGGIALTVALDDGGVWTGYHEEGSAGNSALNISIANGAQWDNQSATKATTVDSLQGANGDSETGFIRMSEAKEAGLTVKDYSGETTFIYKHDAENNILGGDVTINKATDGSIVNVRTGSIGSMDKKEIATVLQALAEKVIAKDAEGNVLKNADKISGQAQIAEGMITSSSSLRFGDIKFNTGSGTVDKDSINYGATAGDYETAMMSGAKSAMTSSAMMWRAEANDIMKRMGDLRMAEGEQGIWAKYYGTKQEMEAQNAKYTNSYKAYQLGYDKKVGDWTVGVAASYGDGESTYANGRGENSVVSLGLYGAWNGNDGQYVDVIMKRSKLDNEYNLNGNVFIGQIEADYETWATSVSAEYGKRFETKKGFYVEPNAELTLGRVEGESYNTSLSLGGERLNVQQDDYDTLVGRLGLRIGQKLDKASYYAKFAVAKEFAGDFDTKYSTIGNSGAIETKETSMSFKDTWYEMQIGGTAQLNDNSYIYASYERNFGADVEQKWRIDAGLRFSF